MNFHDTDLFLHFLVTFEQGTNGVFDRLKKYFQTKKLWRKTFSSIFSITRFFQCSILMLFIDLCSDAYLMRDRNSTRCIDFRQISTILHYTHWCNGINNIMLDVFAQRTHLLGLIRCMSRSVSKNTRDSGSSNYTGSLPNDDKASNEKTSYGKYGRKSFPPQLFCLEIFSQSVKNPIRALLESY